jgi:hypothetical protein
MTASRRRVGFIGVVVAGLLVLGTSCSSSTKSGSSTTTISTADQCSQLKSDMNSIQSEMSSMSTKLNAAGDNAIAQLIQAQKDMAVVATQLQDMSSSVPSAIQSQWETVTNAVTTFSTAFSAIDMNNVAQPAVLAQVQAATNALNDNTAAQQAGDAVNAWIAQNCGTTGTTN